MKDEEIFDLKPTELQNIGSKYDMMDRFLNEWHPGPNLEPEIITF